MKKSKKQRKIETAKRLVCQDTINKNKSGYQKYQYMLKKIRSIDERIDVANKQIEDILRKNYYLIDEKCVLKPERYIVMAAVRDDDTGRVFYCDLNSCHTDIKHDHKLRNMNTTDGFVDNYCEFLDRIEAAKVAFEAGQCSDRYLNGGLLSTSFQYLGYFSDNNLKK